MKLQENRKTCNLMLRQRDFGGLSLSDRASLEEYEEIAKFIKIKYIEYLNDCPGYPCDYDSMESFKKDLQTVIDTMWKIEYTDWDESEELEVGLQLFTKTLIHLWRGLKDEDIN